MESTREQEASERQSLLSRSKPTLASAGSSLQQKSQGLFRVLKKYLRFVGPGFLVSVAYIDPGNYATDVAAGATFRFKLLFTVLLSNVFAIVLQSLSIKLGTVTGLNLAENCKAHLPPWMNYSLYAFAELAIIATDVAEVIGTAISLNILFGWPLVVGCVVSIVDVLAILVFYKPTGMTMTALRLFEGFVMLLVLGVVVCFAYLLSLLKDAQFSEVMKGFLPSREIFTPTGLYQSCGILGATVMPHSLYLGSGIVQARLHDYDKHVPEDHHHEGEDRPYPEQKYKPSMSAIKSCLWYSIAETAISLLTFALFVNSAILIVAGSALYSVPEATNGDIFLIHSLLSSLLSPLAGTVFALSLLLSGTSAGIVCTIAGQMVAEGQLRWRVHPAVRRLITRSISIIPSLIIAILVGREGLNIALEGSQVVLSAILPIVTAPLIWFTCNSRIMSVSCEKKSLRLVESASEEEDDREGVQVGEDEGQTSSAAVSHPNYGSLRRAGSPERQNVVQDSVLSESTGTDDGETEKVSMRNSKTTTVISVGVWGFVVVLNLILLVLMGLGLV